MALDSSLPTYILNKETRALPAVTNLAVGLCSLVQMALASYAACVRRFFEPTYKPCSPTSAHCFLVPARYMSIALWIKGCDG